MHPPYTQFEHFFARVCNNVLFPALYLFLIRDECYIFGRWITDVHSFSAQNGPLLDEHEAIWTKLSFLLWKRQFNCRSKTFRQKEE